MGGDIMRKCLVVIFLLMTVTIACAQSVSVRTGGTGCTAVLGGMPIGCAKDGTVTWFEGGGTLSNTVSLGTTTSVGDLIGIYAWCDDGNNNFVVGGCTPVSLSMGSNTVKKVTVATNPMPAGGASGDAGTGQACMYYVLSAAAANQTITFTTVEDVQLQVAYIDFQPSAGYTFSHDSTMEAALGSGQSGTANAPSYTLTSANAPALILDLTICSTHCDANPADGFPTPFTSLQWPSTMFYEIQQTANAFVYKLNATAGTYTNHIGVLNGGSARWQSLIASFKLVPVSGSPPAAPAGLAAVVQ
jgi:hypothetical protein